MCHENDAFVAALGCRRYMCHDAGAVQPSRTVCHTMGGATTALRQLSQARHVGKVVVRSASAQVPIHIIICRVDT